MKVVAIIQARMGSTRLPGKSLRQLGDKTVLAHVISRVQCATNIDEIIIATTVQPRDEAIVQEALRLGVKVYRGDEQDVLKRYYEAATFAKAELVIRVTADCPFLDGTLLTKMVLKFQQEQINGIDYLSNSLMRTYPRGFDVECFTYRALAIAHENANAPYEREHVTPFIYLHTHVFKLYNYLDLEDHSHIRLTLDTPEDWEFLTCLYQRLKTLTWEVTSENIYQLLAQEPALCLINNNVKQKELEFK